MPELVVDFSEAQSFEPIPKGWYLVTITDAQPGKSQAGNPKVSVRMEVTDPAELAGRSLFDDLVLTGKGAWKTRQLCEALFGASEEEQIRLDTDDFIGGECEVRVTQQVWREEDGGDGESRNRVSRYREVRLSEDDLSGLVDSMTTPDPAAQVTDELEIPF